MEGYDDVMDDDSMVPQNVEGSVEKEAGPYFSLYFGVYLCTDSKTLSRKNLDVLRQFKKNTKFIGKGCRAQV